MEKDCRQEGVWTETANAPLDRGARWRAFLKEHVNVIWRLFFIQSSRNARTLDGLGFYSLCSPLLRTWVRPGEDVRGVARRQLGYFNAGLYLSSAVAGVVGNMEKRRARGENVTPDHIDRVKEALSSVLAARANYFFDMLLIPLGLTIASISAMYHSYIGLVIFLALYNFYHFRTRIGGYCKGAELGERMGGAFVSRLFPEERFLSACAALVSGVFAALLFVKAWDAGSGGYIVWGAIVLAGSAALRRKLSFVWSVTALLFATALYLVAYPFVMAKFR